MNRRLSILLLFTLLLGCCQPMALAATEVGAQTAIRVLVNGDELPMDTSAILVNDRVMVPFRALFEALGATVSYDADTGTATGEKDSTSVTLTVGSDTATIDGRPYTLDAPALERDGRILVPLRFIGEALGAQVEWDEGTRTASVSLSKPEAVYSKSLYSSLAPQVTYAPYKNTSFNANLTGMHPRLVIGSNITSQELERRKTDRDYAEFYTSAMSFGGYLSDNGDWMTSSGDLQTYQWRVQNAAMAYVLSGDTKYSKKVVVNTLKTASFDSWDDENGGGMSNAFGLMGMTIAYDWCYDQFSASERTQVRDKILLQAQRLKWAWENNTGGQGYWQNDYQNNHMQMRIAALLYSSSVLMGDPEADAEAIELYNFVEPHLLNCVDYIGTDGSSDESPQYEVYGYDQLFKAVTLYEGVSGVNLFQTSEGLKNFGDFRAYTYIPGLTDWVPWGDYNSGLFYFNNILFKAASEYGDGQLQQFALDAYAVNSSSFQYPCWTLLYYDDSVVPQTWLKPGYKYFPDIEIANFRSGWGNDDISMSLKSGPPGGHRLNDWSMRGGTYHYVNVAHSKPDAGNIFISFAGKRWGEYPLYDTSIGRLTRYHNTLLVDGYGQNLEGGTWAQPYCGMNDQAYISEFFGSDGYGFTTGDAHKAYKQAANMSKFDRSVFFIDNRYYVSFDDAAKTGNAGTFEYLFHNQGDWTGSLQDGYVINQDGDKMSLYVMMPTNATSTLTPPDTSKASLAALGSELSVKNSAAANSAQFMSVYFPQLNGETLAQKPELTSANNVAQLTVKRSSGKTDMISIHAQSGNISAPDASGSAKSIFYTKDAQGITNCVMINGTQLSLPAQGISFSATHPLNLRYEREGDSFKFWVAKPLKTVNKSSVLTISGLEANTAYTLSKTDGTIVTASTDEAGAMSIDLKYDADPNSLQLIGQ